MKKFQLEICCGSADDVFSAKEGGADRVELNSALYLGGLTPSLGTVREAAKAGISIMVMLRPRDGGFCYTEKEFSSMLNDMRAFSEENIDGFVFGILNPDGTIDVERNRILAEAAGEKEIVFHRAFDVVPNWKEAMDKLIEIGFNRILTSGQASNAIEGSAVLRDMREYAAGRIEILPGGGIRPYNITKLIEDTGCTQAHASAGSIHIDTSCAGNTKVHFGSSPDMPENEFKVTNPEKVRALISYI